MKKCQAVGTTADLEAKKAGEKWLYVAAYEACRAVATAVDPLVATQYLCDVSLCAHNMGDVFVKGLEIVDQCSHEEMLIEKLSSLYDTECRDEMGERQAQLERVLSMVHDSHESSDVEMWHVVAVQNAVMAVKRRQRSPLSLIEPVYLGDALRELANEVGSPVVITNDMRLTSLSTSPLAAVRGTNVIRTVSRLCKWVIEEGDGELACPYAGCPGCPPQRANSWCKTDAREILKLPDDIDWCCLYFSAKQMRLVEVVINTA